MTLQPWPRTGSGTATDGKPKFALDRFDQAYFHRLRARVIAAANEGIYAGTYSVEWGSVNSREGKDAGDVTVGGDGSSRFTAPFAVAGPAMLYLKRVGR